MENRRALTPAVPYPLGRQVVFFVFLLLLFFPLHRGCVGEMVRTGGEVYLPSPGGEGFFNGLTTNGRVSGDVVTLPPDGSLGLSSKLDPIEPPFTAEVRVLIQAGQSNALRLDLARAEDGSLLYYRWGDGGAAGSGLFFERGPDMGQLSGAAPRASSGQREVRLSLGITKKGWTLRSPGMETVSGTLDFAVERAAVSLQSGNTRTLKATLLALRRGAGEAPGALLAGGHLTPWPLFWSLPRALGLDPLSGGFLLLSLALLAALAFAFDRGALALYRHKGAGLPLSETALVLALFPSQAALLYLLAGCLDLPLYALLVTLGLVLLTKLGALGPSSGGLFRAGLPPWWRRRRGALLGLGLGLHALVALQVALSVDRGGQPGGTAAALVFGLVPLLLLLLALRRGRPLHLLLFVPAGLQTLHTVWIGAITPLDRGVLPLLVCFGPWIAVVSGDLVRAGRLSRWPARALRLGCWVLLLLALDNAIYPAIDGSQVEPRVVDLRWDVEQTTNLLGTQDKKPRLKVHERFYAWKKPAGTLRLVALGSSSTFGTGSTDPDTYSWPAQLERLLRGQLADGSRLQVINGGLAGVPFTILQVYLEEVLLRLDPDLVLIYFGGNGDNLDSQTLYARVQQELKDSPFVSTTEEVWAALQLRPSSEAAVHGFLSLAKNSRLFLLSLWALKELRLSVAGLSGRGDDPEAVAPRPVLERSAEAAVRACVARGVPVLLLPEICRDTVIGGDIGSEGTCASYYQIWSDLAEKYGHRGVHHQSLFHRFTPQFVKRYFIDEVHMTDRGYRYLARQIFEVIREEGLLPLRVPAQDAPAALSDAPAQPAAAPVPSPDATLPLASPVRP